MTCEASTRPGTCLACSVSRAASFTASPMTVYSSLLNAPSCPANTCPVATPMPRSSSPRAATASRMVRAAHRAAPAASACRAGAPNTHSAASPWNLLTSPPWASTASTTSVNSALSLRTTSSGGVCAASAVESTTSTNRAVTSRTSPESEMPCSSTCRTTSSPTCLPNRSRNRSRSASPVARSLTEAWSMPISLASSMPMAMSRRPRAMSSSASRSRCRGAATARASRPVPSAPTTSPIAASEINVRRGSSVPMSGGSTTNSTPNSGTPPARLQVTTSLRSTVAGRWPSWRSLGSATGNASDITGRAVRSAAR